MNPLDAVAQARPMMDAFFPRGAVPTAADTAKAKRDAQGVLDWLRANLSKHRDSADVARELEDMLFHIGSIRMLWALLPEENEAGRYLVEREALLKGTPLAIRAAPARAERREHEERAAMFDTVHNLRLTAARLDSKQLRKAADTVEQMQGFFRVEPDGPARIASRNTGKSGGEKRAKPRERTRKAMIAEYRKLKNTTAYAAAYDTALGMVDKYRKQAGHDGWEVKGKNPAAQLYKIFSESEKTTL